MARGSGFAASHGEGETGRVHVVRVDGDEENLTRLRDIKDGRDIFLDVIRLNFAELLQNSHYDLTQPQLTAAYFEHYFYRRADVMAVNQVFWWEHNSKAGQYSSAKVHKSLTVKGDGTFALDGEATPGLTAEVINGF